SASHAETTDYPVTLPVFRFIFYITSCLLDLLSFPTRRSSDLKDFLKVRCRLALLPFLISCLIWLDLVASPTKSSNLSETAEVPRSEERLSRNAETDLVCRLLIEKKKHKHYETIVHASSPI